METSWCADDDDILYQFKSYYVVWKPERTYAASKRLSWFKSYYVVWKLFCEKIKNLPEKSLNRTM